MRIVNLQQMLREPNGTVFSVEQFQNISDLFIKTGNREDGKGIHHNTLIAPRQNPDSGSSLTEIDEAIEDPDVNIQLDFDAVHSFTRRDEVYICIYSVEEINKMIEKLQAALHALPIRP